MLPQMPNMAIKFSVAGPLAGLQDSAYGVRTRQPFMSGEGTATLFKSMRIQLNYQEVYLSQSVSISEHPRFAQPGSIGLLYLRLPHLPTWDTVHGSHILRGMSRQPLHELC